MTFYTRSIPSFTGFIGNPLTLMSGSSADSMNSSYVYGTSGVTHGICLAVPPAATTITDVYVYVATLGGTAASVVLRTECRNMSTTVAGKPDTTVYGTQDFSGFTTTGRWYQLTYSTPIPLPAAGTPIAWVMGNASPTPGTNYPSIHRIASQNTNVFSGPGFISRVLSLNGWVTSNTLANMVTPILVKFDDGTIYGSSFIGTTVTNYASNTRERGLYIPASGYDRTVNFVAFGTASTAYSGLKIIKDTTAPGATPGTGELNLTFSGFERINGGMTIQPSFTFLAGQAYRAVLVYSSAAVQPQYFSIPDYGRYADVDAANFWNDPLSAYGTIDNGSGGWTDSPSVMPRLGFFEERFPAISSGGGGSSGSRLVGASALVSPGGLL